jgi:hypothetical protein
MESRERCSSRIIQGLFFHQQLPAILSGGLKAGLNYLLATPNVFLEFLTGKGKDLSA